MELFCGILDDLVLSRSIIVKKYYDLYIWRKHLCCICWKEFIVIISLLGTGSSVYKGTMKA